MKDLFDKIIFRISLIFSNEFSKVALYSKYLGVQFGERVRITGDPEFGSEPYLITIGSDVTIADGVTFYNHDGGVGVLRHKYPGIDIIKPITVGNNVFIGSHSTIMPGISIGNNVIIGTGSLVTRNVPDNVVVVGIPARIIKTIEEYEEKVLQDAIFIKDRLDKNGRKNEILNLLKADNSKIS